MCNHGSLRGHRDAASQLMLWETPQDDAAAIKIGLVAHMLLDIKGGYKGEPATPQPTAVSRHAGSMAKGCSISAERSGEMHIDKASVRLYHGIQSQRSWMREGEIERSVSCFLRRKQVHVHLINSTV